MPHLWLSEHRMLRGDREVRGQGILAPRPQGPAIDRANDRLRQFPHVLQPLNGDAVDGTPAVEELCHRSPLGQARRPRGLRLIATDAHVGAGRESASRAGQHDSSHLRIFYRLIECLVEFRSQPFAESVSRSGRLRVISTPRRIYS
jgi:hypothetical protein